MHTSASLTINENASSDVPLDLNVSEIAIVQLNFQPCLLPYTTSCTHVYTGLT